MTHDKTTAWINKAIPTTCISILLTGCGLLGYDYVYDRIDKLLADKMEHTLNLNRPQKHLLAKSLDTFHQQHRITELPYYAAYLDYVNALSRDGLTADETKAVMKNFDVLYARLMAQFFPILASTLNGLDNNQLAHLEKQFGEYNDEKHRELGIASPEERVRARIDRHRKAYAFWLGNLTVQQKMLIEKNARVYPDIEPLWHNRRLTMQQTLLSLLRQRADNDTLTKFLYQWWVGNRHKPPALTDAEQQARRKIVVLTVDIFAELEPRQKRHLHNRLEEIARSLEALTPEESRAKIVFYREAFLQNAVHLSASANCFSVAPDKTLSSC